MTEKESACNRIYVSFEPNYYFHVVRNVIYWTLTDAGICALFTTANVIAGKLRLTESIIIMKSDNKEIPIEPYQQFEGIIEKSNSPSWCWLRV